MAKKKNKTKKPVVENKTPTTVQPTSNEKPVENTPVTETPAETIPEEPKQKELVMKTTFKEQTYEKSTCLITNTSMNNICLCDGNAFDAINVAPREIKEVDREQLKRLLKNEMVRRFFDKGILTHTLDAAEVSAHDAVVPENLKNPVERHEGGQNVKAEVKKFDLEGTVKIDLE